MKPIFRVGIGALLLGAVYWGGYHVGGVSAQKQQAVPAPVKVKKPPKILYYRNPMGAPDISKTPKQDEMGMDYLPVYADGEEPTATDETSADDIRISADKVQKLGVKTAAAEFRVLGRSIQTVGRLQVDERRISTISPKFEGWIDTLNVNDVGQTVSKGQPLFVVYMHELYDAEAAYRLAVRATVDPAATPAQYKEAEIQASTRYRQLERLGAANDELERLRRGGDPSMTQTYRSPINGVVLEKMAVQGMRFMPGEPLFKIADLSSLALMVDVPVADLPQVKVGSKVVAVFDGHPNEPVEGVVDFIYPTVKAETRTVAARVMVNNAQRRWPAGLLAQVTIKQGSGRRLAVPESAVLDSGEKQVVLVARGEGRYQARVVKTGVRADGYIAIVDGLEEGEDVVIAANFLLDSESNLQAALRGFGAAK